MRRSGMRPVGRSGPAEMPSCVEATKDLVSQWVLRGVECRVRASAFVRVRCYARQPGILFGRVRNEVGSRRWEPWYCLRGM